MKKKSFLLITIAVILIFAIGIFYIIIDNKKNDNYIYKIIYYEDYIPGASHEIYLYDDGKVNIITKQFCSALDCKIEPIKKELKFSKDNMILLKNYIKSLFKTKDKKEITIMDNEISERERNLFSSIVNNNEYIFELSIEDYQFRIMFSDDKDSYFIDFKQNKEVKVSKLKVNEKYDIINIDSFIIKFNKKNKKIIDDFFYEQFNNYSEKEKEYDSDSINEKELSIFKSIVNNNESYLEIEN